MASLPCPEFYHVLRCLLVHIDAYGCTSRPINPSIPLSLYSSTHLRAGLHAYRPSSFAQSTAFRFFPMIHVYSQTSYRTGGNLLGPLDLGKSRFPRFHQTVHAVVLRGMGNMFIPERHSHNDPRQSRWKWPPQNYLRLNALLLMLVGFPCFNSSPKLFLHSQWSIPSRSWTTVVNAKPNMGNPKPVLSPKPKSVVQSPHERLWHRPHTARTSPNQELLPETPEKASWHQILPWCLSRTWFWHLKVERKTGNLLGSSRFTILVW